MVAYSFQKRFATPILDRTKVHTIRADRKRHARPGEEMQLYSGMRTKHCRLISRETCAAVLPIAIDIDGHEILVGLGYPDAPPGFEATWTGPDIRLTGTVLTYRNGLNGLAIRDGFSCFEEMRDFWIEEHGALGPDQIFVGKLIGWWQ